MEDSDDVKQVQSENNESTNDETSDQSTDERIGCAHYKRKSKFVVSKHIFHYFQKTWKQNLFCLWQCFIPLPPSPSPSSIDVDMQQ